MNNICCSDMVVLLALSLSTRERELQPDRTEHTRARGGVGGGATDSGSINICPVRRRNALRRPERRYPETRDTNRGTRRERGEDGDLALACRGHQPAPRYAAPRRTSRELTDRPWPLPRRLELGPSSPPSNRLALQASAAHTFCSLYANYLR